MQLFPLALRLLAKQEEAAEPSEVMRALPMLGEEVGVTPTGLAPHSPGVSK